MESIYRQRSFFRETMLGMLCLTVVVVWEGAELTGRSVSGLIEGIVCVAVALAWRRLSPVSRYLFFAAIVLGITYVVWAPNNISSLMHAAYQGGGFFSLMVMLGVIRRPIRTSRMATNSAEAIFTLPEKKQYAGTTVVAHFLSLLFNLGVISIISDLLKSPNSPRNVVAPADGLILGAMRGASITSAWSPMGVGFSLVIVNIKALNSSVFLASSFICSMAMLIVSCWRVPSSVSNFTEDNRESAGIAFNLLRDGVKVGGVIAVGLGMIVAIHKIFLLAYLASTVLMMVAGMLMYMMFTGRNKGVGRHLFEDASTLSSEGVIFFSANIVGAALVGFSHEVFLQHPQWSIPESGFGAFTILLVGLVAAPALSAVYVPHSVLLVVMAQFVGSQALAYAHPLSVAMMLTFCWVMSISTSPMSAVAVLTGRCLGVSAYRVGVIHNFSFVIRMFGVAFVAVTFIYCAGY